MIDTTIRSMLLGTKGEWYNLRININKVDTMAKTRPPIAGAANTWVDLYAATSGHDTPIASGTWVIVQNIGTRDVWFSESATAPAGSDGYYVAEPNRWIDVDAGNVGFWAKSPVGTMKVQMEVA